MCDIHKYHILPILRDNLFLLDKVNQLKTISFTEIICSGTSARPVNWTVNSFFFSVLRIMDNLPAINLEVSKWFSNGCLDNKTGVDLIS